jgi:hypothetical protein
MSNEDKSLQGQGRPQQLDENKIAKELYPFEAFETSLVDGNENPVLTLKSLWKLDATLTEYPTQMNVTIYDLTSSGAVKALPTAVGYTDEITCFWSNGTVGGYNLSFTTVSSQTIDGIAASNWLGEGKGVITLVSDNSNWRVKEYQDDGLVAGALTGGYWEKKMNGDLICKNMNTGTTITTGTASGNIYINNADITFTFPHAFNSIYNVDPQVQQIGDIVWPIDRSALTLSTTQYSMRLAGSSSGGQGYAGYIAYGKWK